MCHNHGRTLQPHRSIKHRINRQKRRCSKECHVKRLFLGGVMKDKLNKEQVRPLYVLRDFKKERNGPILKHYVPWIFPNSLVRINHTVYILPWVFSVHDYSLSLSLSLSERIRGEIYLYFPNDLSELWNLNRFMSGEIERVSTINLQIVFRHNYTSDLVEWMNESFGFRW